MKTRLFCLCGLLVSFAFYAIFFTFLVLTDYKKSSIIEYFCVSCIFALMFGIATFALLKGRYGTKQNQYYLSSTNQNHTVRKIYRWIKILTNITLVYMTLWIINDEMINNGHVYLIILVSVLVVSFIIVFALQHLEAKRFLKYNSKELINIDNHKCINSRFILLNFSKLFLYISVGYALFFYLGAKSINTRLLDVFILLGCSVVCMLLRFIIVNVSALTSFGFNI